MTAGSPIL